jgi:glycosyltransferase involved in cell wall biosynthesis
MNERERPPSTTRQPSSSTLDDRPAVRICLVYDCLYPHTVGGAERWYRNVAERLAAAGHEVTYLTLRQWERGSDPGVAGVDVRAVGPPMELYVQGRRRLLPPIAFGAGVLLHLLRRGRRYDVVHTASFPYFSLLAAGFVRPVGRFRIVVDWHEVWTREYWRDYAGPVAGTIGWLVQRLGARIGDRAFCFSRLHAGRLRALGFPGEVTVLEGEYAGPVAPARPTAAEPLVVFAGRHIPEKRVTALVPAFARARERIPGLRGEIFGDGPERADVLRLVAEHGLDGALSAPGRVESSVIEDALRRALCHVLPSRREGYGLVVVEAAAAGTPSVVVRDPDNAATELIEDGVNGVIAPSADPEDLAAAIVQIHDSGRALRESTSEWFMRNARRLSLGNSLTNVMRAYED